jgi:hypothetical protein
VDTPTIPEGQTCAQYRRRRQPEKERGPWTRAACRVLAVALYHAGFVSAYHRDGHL